MITNAKMGPGNCNLPNAGLIKGSTDNTINLEWYFTFFLKYIAKT